jgi:hypothetical protein
MLLKVLAIFAYCTYYKRCCFLCLQALCLGPYMACICINEAQTCCYLLRMVVMGQNLVTISNCIWGLLAVKMNLSSFHPFLYRSCPMNSPHR